MYLIFRIKILPFLKKNKNNLLFFKIYRVGDTMGSDNFDIKKSKTFYIVGKFSPWGITKSMLKKSLLKELQLSFVGSL